MLEIFLTIITTIASGIAIYEFLQKRFSEPEKIEKIFEKPKIDDDEMVLSVSYKNPDSATSLVERKIGEYAKAIGANEFDEFYFVNNPRGAFMASKGYVLYFLSLSLVPYFFIVVNMLAAPEKNLFSPENSHSWTFYLGLSIALLLTPLGFYQSFKNYKRIILIKNYLQFLSENDIRLGYRITQSREKYGQANK